MPPRTGPRRKRRVKQSAPAALRHFTVVRDDTSGAGYSVRTELAVAHHIELDNGHLVLRDQAGAIIQIIAAGEWREIRPAEVTRGATIGDIPYPEDADKDRIDNPAVYSGTMQREEATLDPPAAHDAVTRVDEPDRQPAVNSGPFVPSSPEEAQRILMELERRLRSPEGLEPNYQDPSDAAPPTRKD